MLRFRARRIFPWNFHSDLRYGTFRHRHCSTMNRAQLRLTMAGPSHASIIGINLRRVIAGLYLEHPQFEGFEVRQTVKPAEPVAA